MNTLEVYFPLSPNNSATDLWRLRLQDLGAALRALGVKVTTIVENTAIPSQAVLHFELNQSEDLKNLEWVSQFQAGKKILVLNQMMWMRNKEVISPFLKFFDKVFLESDSAKMPADLEGKVTAIPWMQVATSTVTKRSPSVVGLASEPFVSGLPFEKSLEDTDWNFFSVNQKDGHLTVNSFEGSARDRKKSMKDPVESNDLLHLALNAKALLFKDLGDKFDFLFLEYLSRSGKILVDESCDLPLELQGRVLQDKLGETESQRECLGQALNNFELNMEPHLVVSVEERAKQFAEIYLKFQSL